MHKRNQPSNGFTIVELLIVIVVIAILAAISIVAYTGIQNRAVSSSIKSDLTNNAKKLEQYNVLNGKYPETQNEFRAAGLSFTLSAYRLAVYCAGTDGTDPTWALIAITSTDERLYQTRVQNWQTYTGSLGSSATVCADAGVTSASVAIWLKGNSGWHPWVVN